jgi:hypothetical protein
VKLGLTLQKEEAGGILEQNVTQNIRNKGRQSTKEMENITY